ncbi:MAG: hypothetical protein R3E08_03300 [Thiotrichaceae bacterium]
MTAYQQQVELEQLAAAVAEEEAAEASEPPEELDVEVDGSQQISLGSAEVVEILTSELEGIKEELATHLTTFTTLNNEQAGFSEAAEKLCR